jgi:predicted PurR-regulated permease PerM
MPYDSERERITSLAFYGFVLLLGYLVFRLFQPFLAPLGWAAVLVVLFHPVHVRLEKRIGRTSAAFASTAGVTFIVIVPGLLVMTAFVQEARQAINAVDAAFEAGELQRVQAAWQYVQKQFIGNEPSDLAAIAQDGAAQVAAFVAAQAGAILLNVAMFFFHAALMLFAAFFLFRDAGTVMGLVRRVLPFQPEQSERMIRETHELIFATITSGLIVAAIQGGLGGVTFAALGIQAPVFWGVVMAFFALLPFVGAWVVWFPAAIWLILAGDVGRGLILIIVGAGIVGTVDNLLRPALLSGRARLNGLVVFISLVGGLALFGPLGLVMGPIVVATAAGLLEAYTKPYPSPEPGEVPPAAVV